MGSDQDCWKENHNFQSLGELTPDLSKYSSIALYDLDHTLLNVNSSYCFGKHLYRQGVFSTSKMIKLAGYYALHKANLLSMQSMQIKIFNSLFKGFSYQFFMNIAEDFFQKSIDAMIYLPAYQELKEFLARGDFVAILSSSPDFLVRPISKLLGVNYSEASTYYVGENGTFTHISRLMLGEQKAQYSQLCAKKLNIDKSKVCAYSDSILDLPLLLSVGSKVAVKPDRYLKSYCKGNDWRII